VRRLPPAAWAGILAIVVVAIAVVLGLLIGPEPSCAPSPSASAASSTSSTPAASTTPSACATASPSATG